MAGPTVSLTMIVRDEERHLAACLGPVRDLFADVVVVDTRSADRTREVAAGLGARVFDVPWADSFSAARNAALDRATGAWAVRLDADDRLDPDNVAKLGALLAALPADPVAYTVRYRHHLGPDMPSLDQPDVRVFPNRPDVRWRYRVHEQIGPAMLAAGGREVSTDLRIDHLGHSVPGRNKGKLDRYVRLLTADLADYPGDPFPVFYLGHTLLGLGRPAEAAPWLARASRDAPANWPLRARAWGQWARALRAAGRSDEARRATAAGVDACPRDAELAYLDGCSQLAAGNPAAAERRFRFLLSGAAVESDPPFEPGTCGYKARDGLARCLGPDRAADKEALWRAAVAEAPGFVPAWCGLGELLAAAGRWAERDTVVDAVAALSPADADVLRGTGLAVRGNYPAARGVLAAATERHPTHVGVWVALARVLVLQGTDRRAADRALRRAAALAPDSPDVRRLRGIVARWR
jgi:Flp pilus assembly protein TadD